MVLADTICIDDFFVQLSSRFSLLRLNPIINAFSVWTILNRIGWERRAAQWEEPARPVRRWRSCWARTACSSSSCLPSVESWTSTRRSCTFATCLPSPKTLLGKTFGYGFLAVDHDGHENQKWFLGIYVEILSVSLDRSGLPHSGIQQCFLNELLDFKKKLIWAIRLRSFIQQLHSTASPAQRWLWSNSLCACGKIVPQRRPVVQFFAVFFFLNKKVVLMRQWPAF